jgi:primosomal replication protein N
MVSAKLMHGSEQVEAGVVRRVEFEMVAVAAGQIAEMVERAEMGRMYRFCGFIARKNRNSKALVFHLANFETIS